jgi:hypothetical protein
MRQILAPPLLKSQFTTVAALYDEYTLRKKEHYHRFRQNHSSYVSHADTSGNRREAELKQRESDQWIEAKASAFAVHDVVLKAVDMGLLNSSIVRRSTDHRMFRDKSLTGIAERKHLKHIAGTMTDLDFATYISNMNVTEEEPKGEGDVRYGTGQDRSYQ